VASVYSLLFLICYHRIKKAKSVLQDIVQGIVIVQDREGDIYEQFAVIADEKTDLLI